MRAKIIGNDATRLYDCDSGKEIDVGGRTGYFITDEQIQRNKIYRIVQDKSGRGVDSTDYGEFVWYKYITGSGALQFTLSGIEIALLIQIAIRINYDNVVYFGNRIPKSLNKCLNMMDVNPNRVTTYSDNFKKNDVLSSSNDEDDCVVLNENIFCKGKIKRAAEIIPFKLKKSANMELYKKYYKTRLSTLGALYELIPYVHERYNVVCYNQTCKCEENIKPIKLNDISLILGRNGRGATLQQMFTGLTFDSYLGELECVAFPYNNKKTKYMVVNPLLYTAGYDHNYILSKYDFTHKETENSTSNNN